MNHKKVKRSSHPHCEISAKFSNSISDKILEEIMNSSSRNRLFNPLKTLQLFLREVTEGLSLKAVLTNLNIERASSKDKLVSMNTGSYSRAKKALPENLLRKLCFKSNISSNDFNWKNRDVKIIDGTTMQMADTFENQKIYPQIKRQKKGLGQPIMRCLAVFAYATGSLTDIEISPYAGKGTAEPSLLRRVLPRLKEESILIMDRFFTNYFLHLDMEVKKIDFLVRLKDSVGEKIFKKNEKDKILFQERPARPSKMSVEEYYYYCERTAFRFIKFKSMKNGFRDKVFYFKTSLLDKKTYSMKEICFLYMQRWDVEVNIRNLKRTLGSYFLKSKSPAMVRKELYMKILAYNLVRNLIILSTSLLSPQKYSFKTTLFFFRNVLSGNFKTSIETIQALLKKEILKERERHEPRMLKRRLRGTFGLLMISRNAYKSQHSMA